MIEEITQGIRAWWLAAVPGLTSAKIIPADDKGPQPTPPFVTVAVRNVRKVGTDEARGHADGQRVRALRRASVEVQGYGAASAEWAILAELYAAQTPAPAEPATFDVEEIGPLQYLPSLRDTAIEARYAQEYTVFFELAPEEARAIDGFDYAVITAELASPQGDDLTDTVYAPEEPTPP